MKHTNISRNRQPLLHQIDWFTTLVPFFCIIALCIWFVTAPEASSGCIAGIRAFLGDTLGSYYLIIGLGVFGCSMYMAFSPYGQICLGNDEKPKYSNFSWGAMIFTAGLAEDILFYS